MNYSNKNNQEIESSIHNLEKKASNINIKIKALQKNNYLKKGILEKDLKIKPKKLKKKKKVLIFILYITILISLTLLAITYEINLMK